MCLRVCLSVCLAVWLPACLPASLPVSQSVSLSVCLFVRLCLMSLFLFPPSLALAITLPPTFVGAVWRHAGVGRFSSHARPTSTQMLQEGTRRQSPTSARPAPSPRRVPNSAGSLSDVCKVESGEGETWEMVWKGGEKGGGAPMKSHGEGNESPGVAP